MTEISYGSGGWVRVREGRLPGPLYLRFREDNGRPVLTELYLDGRSNEIRPSLVRDLEVGALSAFALHDEGEWLSSSAQQVDPDLTVLASNFASSYGNYAGRRCEECGGPVKGHSKTRGREHALTDWTALAWFAQFPGSGIERPKLQERSYEEPAGAPDPVLAPRDGLTDEFLRTVAENYLWAVRTRQRPAVVISAQAQVSPRTVHAWVRKARDRGILPPTTQGSSV